MLAQLIDSNWFPLIYLVVLICMVITGVVVSKKLGVTESADWKSHTLISVIISFFSLLLAFTLSSSADSNKARINALQQHKGAIAGLYRQSFLFDDSLRRSVKDYAMKAIEIKSSAISVNSTEATREQYRRSSIFNTTYLRSISGLVKDDSRPHVGTRSIIDEMNKIIDLDELLHYRNQERTPAAVMLLLLIGSWTIGFLMGAIGVFFRKRYYMGPIIFTTLTALTVLIIQDMDNPHRGFVKPPYEIYKDLQDEINQDEMSMEQ